MKQQEGVDDCRAFQRVSKQSILIALRSDFDSNVLQMAEKIRSKDEEIKPTYLSLH